MQISYEMVPNTHVRQLTVSLNKMDNISRGVPLIMRIFRWQCLSFYDCAWLFYLDANENCEVQFKPFGRCLFDLNNKVGYGSLKDLRPRSTLHWRNLKTQQPPVSLDFCLRKTRTRKTRDHGDAVVFRKAPFSKNSPIFFGDNNTNSRTFVG